MTKEKFRYQNPALLSFSNSYALGGDGCIAGPSATGNCSTNGTSALGECGTSGSNATGGACYAGGNALNACDKGTGVI